MRIVFFILGCFLCLPISIGWAQEETGFVTLFSGQSKYTEQSGSDSSLGSFFLVRLFDGYDFFWGALTFANFSSAANASSSKSGDETENVTISTVFEQRGYGTNFAYVFSTESFIGTQFWIGSAYLTNELDIEHEISEEILRGSGDSEVFFLCEGDSEERAKFNSFPIYLGVGATINNFGIFAQVFQQNTGEIPIKSDTELRCLTGSVVEGRSHQDDDETIDLSFTSTTLGIQYRF